MISADKITKVEFSRVLNRYPALLEGISKSKSTKGDKQTLEQLDKFRFETAPERYSPVSKEEEEQKEAIPLSHEDVVQLVAWKLKHGKFRPNLMNLAQSNTPDSIGSVTRSAFKQYDDDTSAVIPAIKSLATLRGIGPATASLLLSVHDPRNVVFFSDEVYRWVCCSGSNATIKYNFKEYQDLVSKSQKVVQRLKVDARDVEKVGFVLMRDAGGVDAAVTDVEADSSKVALSGVGQGGKGKKTDEENKTKESQAKPVTTSGAKEISKKRKVETTKTETPVEPSQRPKRNRRT